MEVDLLDVLFIVFVILKLCNLINWSWWLVLTPIWIGIIITIIKYLFLR